MIFLSLISLLAVTARAECKYQFPAGFKFGVGTSAYQSEGAWNVSDKGVNIWDEFTHRNPSPIADGTNGDVADDTYHKVKEDIAILKDLGVDFYRFSLSWTRILPTGFSNNVSKVGIQYYKDLLDSLHAVGIEPVVTIYHFDHPLVLEEMGGWTNEMMVTWFADYASVVFRELGDRIKIYSTINEPYINCVLSYGTGALAPGKEIPDHAPYLCMHNMIKAHTKAYKIYHSEYKDHGGQLGMVLPCSGYFPKYSNDTKSADIKYEFECGWMAHPIYSKTGDYPPIMKKRIAENSKLQGYPRSRLPEFTKDEINEIRGSADYFGLNHYTTMLTESAPKTKDGLWLDDSGVTTSYDPKWEQTVNPLFRIVPKGFRDILNRIKKSYNNPTVYVMENGVADNGTTLNDHQRIQYLHDYLRELQLAIKHDKCNVKRYAVWSYIDNFEWSNGYTQHYGLVSVDFEKKSRPRTPKLSYSWFQELLRTRKLPPLE